MKYFTLIVLLTFTLLGCNTSPTIMNIKNDDDKLALIISKYQQFNTSSNPFNKNERGGSNQHLPDLSPASLLNSHLVISTLHDSLMAINVNTLTRENKTNWYVLQYVIKNKLDHYDNNQHMMPLTSESGFHVWISRINNRVKFSEEQDYRDYLNRLSEIPRYFDQQIYWMKEGMALGLTQPQIVLNNYEKTIQAFITDSALQSSYYKPFITMSNNLSAEVAVELKQEAQHLIEDSVFNAYQKYYQFFIDEYQPNARNAISAKSLPNGKEFYENRVRYYTTLNIDSEEVHQIGLQEVKRIKSEMMEILSELKFQGTFAEFLEFLRTDPQFYATTPQQLLKEASFIAKKMDAELPRLFHTLPRTPYGVAPVPTEIAPKYTIGRYIGPATDEQPGLYWVNTYRLDRRPLYVLEALTLHEAVPGHHLQNSLARELKNVPEYRQQTYISAFGEGWGLYSEYLGIEAGFYQDPYSNFGRLTYEMWRACRLVVDTGMHVKGWSREQAVNFLANNTALSLHNVNTEIDRYISWPAQALSYKIGEITIKRLRKKAKFSLGKAFDIREFHYQVLKDGAIPLNLLETRIDEYIEKEKMKSNEQM